MSQRPQDASERLALRGTRLVSASLDRRVCAWELAPPPEADGATQSSSSMGSFFYAPPTDMVAAGGEEAGGRCPQPLLSHTHEDFVRFVSFDHERIVTVSDDGSVQILCFASASSAR